MLKALVGGYEGDFLKSDDRRRMDRELREFEQVTPWMVVAVLFSLPGLYEACRFIGAERRSLRETRTALRLIREDTARRLAAEHRVVADRA